MSETFTDGQAQAARNARDAAWDDYEAARDAGCA